MDQGSEGLLSPWLRVQRMKAALPYIKGSVLDFGCGTGEILTYCNIQEYYGVDINQEALNLAKSKFKDTNFHSELPNNKTFDSIIALAVIEHIKNPEILLSKFKSLLKSNGKIILTTPDPSVDWIHTLGAKIGLFSNHAADEHEQLINQKRMLRIASEVDLQITLNKKFLFGANQLFILENK